ncbi:MAG: AAA family ATPase [Candidatus Moranbacteria bacterium]|nr:AAA family ATPase [Candidatus Moranbacteria bacterium]
MYLKKLEISGFKSFANKTVLDFSSDRKGGITAVVGPNGSGKSNIADAIRWAIGEQSLKNLRGRKSEDVIFAGSSKKARLGNASVTLHFDNADKRIPLEFSEVAITRKFFRSGESEYLINGSRARLLDIVDVLAKSGIGKDSYCVITQGMSDAILNATPLERRGIFEDAAGVKQYQIEKDRSLRKMNSTKDNLIRVDGLILEIEPHLKNLKRQAERASQGKEMAETLRKKQLQLFGFLWHRFDSERLKLAQERDALVRKLAAAEAQSEAIDQSLSNESIRAEDQGAIDALEKAIRDVRIQLNGREREIAIVEGRIQVERERRVPKEVVQSTPVDLAYVRTRLAEFRKDQETLIERLGNVEDLSELQDLKELARVIQTRMFELHEDAGKGAVVTKQTITLPKEELEASDSRLAELEARKTALTKEGIALRKEIAESESAIAGEREKSRLSREKFFELERQARAKQHELSVLKDTLNESKVRLARVEVREEDLVAEIKEELAMEPAQLTHDGQEIDKEVMERDIARLKVVLEQIGNIDPLIVDEYVETEKRYGFLTQESSDLKKAMEALQQVVREMDEKIRKEFDTAFGTISKEFEHYFSLIFGGGKAELAKIRVESRIKNQESNSLNGAAYEDDMSDEEGEGSMQTGIEIFACPPGKRIANLAMLSGGERSLTSLALLFAIISHNPPPFAVLDEVEAALDEANSRRFSRVLQELSHHTQFVAITHNRETMRQASLLYGVTMGDDGISKLLSVRLDQVADDGKLVGA